jgi:hypothetical protein
MSKVNEKNYFLVLGPLGLGYAIFFLSLLSCTNKVRTDVAEYVGEYPLASIQEFSDRLSIDAHQDAKLSELADLSGFEPLTPELIQSEGWEKTLSSLEPERPLGSVWSWREKDFERQVIGHFDQESGEWYYFLRLKLYTLFPEEAIFLPEVRKQLPRKRYSSITIYCSDGNSLKLVRASDGIYFYWRNGIFLEGE